MRNYSDPMDQTTTPTGVLPAFIRLRADVPVIPSSVLLPITAERRRRRA